MVYVSGDESSGKAVIIAPDVWGWNGGRTRAIADLLASSGYYVVVLKVLDPPFEGGTDGDGLPPDFDMGTREREFLDWIKTITCHEIAPKLSAILSEVQGKRVGMLVRAKIVSQYHSMPCSLIAACYQGFCWGAWVCAKTSAELSEAVEVCVCAHPSIQIEGAYGGDPVTLAGAVRCPFHFLPAGNDAKNMYSEEEGGIFLAIKQKHSESSTTYFEDMQHGFVSRGDTSDPKISKDVSVAVKKIQDLFAVLG